MRGIMGLQRGGQVHPDQSDSARAEFWGRHEDAGREIPDDPWLKNMIWLDSLGVQRGERPMLEDKPWWVDLARKLRDLTRRHVPSLEDLDSLPFISEHPNPDLNKTRNLLQHLDSIPFIAEKDSVQGRASGGIIPGYEDGGQASIAQTYDYGVPQQTEQQWADLTDRVVDEGSRGYTPYGGQRLAGFTPQEVAAQQATSAYSTGQGPQGTIDAQGNFQTAGQQQSTAGSLKPYMDQYTEGVTDPQLRQLSQFNQQQMQNLGSQAAGSGAFGGYRQGVMQQQQAMDTSQQASDIIGTGQQQAFQNAQQALQADRQAALGAGQAQTTLGGQQQAQQRQRTGDLGMVGQQRRDLQQKSLDVGYQDFQNRLNQERKNVDWQTSAMSNLPYKPGVTQTTYGTGPSDWSKGSAKVLGADDVKNTTVPGQRHGGIVGPMYSQFLRGMRR